MRNALIFIIFLLLVGCSSSLKQSWIDFRAHYNTFYNAEESFNAGLSKIEEQSVEINPNEELVEVHIQYPPAGSEDFQRAIEKSARILEKFSDSKYADEALFLIGQSSYYRQEYYPALERFEELYEYSSRHELRQEAIIWQGRTLLHSNQYSRGIDLLEQVLDEFDRWDISLEAEAGVLLAELYAQQEEYNQAVSLLNRYSGDLDNNNLKARSYFLYGQVLERIERYQEAFFAYEEVSSFYPDYQYEFWAELNRGRMARMSGNIDLAEDVFQRMKNDNKNTDFIDEIDFQIALTEELREDYRQAENSYRYILDNNRYNPSEEIRARIYYQLGEIYSTAFDDFDLASVYYDSSSSLRNRLSTAPDQEENVEQQAEFFGKYTDLREEVTHIDSLLALADLGETEIESVLQELRAQRISELKEGNEESSNEENVLVNVQSEQEDSSVESTIISGLGFLGHRDEDRVDQGRNAFRLQWGNRSFVDNWRRVEAIRGVGSDDEEESFAGEQDEYSDEELGIYPEEIPRSDTQRQALQQEQEDNWYELGNLFYLSLDQPDSAAVYYKKIVDQSESESLRARSQYALHELFESSGNEKKADAWRKRLLEEHPDSEFAAILEEEKTESSEDERKKILADFTDIEQRSDSTDLQSTAEEYRQLALDNLSSELAPHIHFRAIETYLKLGKEQADPDRYNQFLRTILDDEQEQPNESPRDTLISNNFPVTDLRQEALSGTAWDSTRVLLKEYSQHFDDAPHQARIDTLQSIIGDSMDVNRSIKSCEQLNINPVIDPDLEEFLESVDWPESLQNQRFSGSMIYDIVILPDGSVRDFELRSPSTLPELKSAFDSAIENEIRFEPISEIKEEEQVRCTFIFPIRN